MIDQSSTNFEVTVVSSDAPHIRVGEVLGSYEIVGVLGEGGMGRVFHGRHLRLGRDVALKVLHPQLTSRADVVQRFLREANAANRIHHENIVQIHDYVEQQEVPG